MLPKRGKDTSGLFDDPPPLPKEQGAIALRVMAPTLESTSSPVENTEEEKPGLPRDFESDPILATASIAPTKDEPPVLAKDSRLVTPKSTSPTQTLVEPGDPDGALEDFRGSFPTKEDQLVTSSFEYEPAEVSKDGREEIKEYSRIRQPVQDLRSSESSKGEGCIVLDLSTDERDKHTSLIAEPGAVEVNKEERKEGITGERTKAAATLPVSGRFGTVVGRPLTRKPSAAGLPEKRTNSGVPDLGEPASREDHKLSTQLAATDDDSRCNHAGFSATETAENEAFATVREIEGESQQPSFAPASLVRRKFH